MSNFCSCDPNPYPVLPPQTQPRTEVRYKHTLDAALTIYRTEGARAFFRGLLPSLLGITHVAVQFPLYEHLKRVAGEHAPFPLQPLPPPGRITHRVAKHSPRAIRTADPRPDPGVLRRREDDRVNSDIPARGRADAAADAKAAARRRRRQQRRARGVVRGHRAHDEAHDRRRGLARALPRPVREPRAHCAEQRGDDVNVSLTLLRAGLRNGVTDERGTDTR